MHSLDLIQTTGDLMCFSLGSFMIDPHGLLLGEIRTLKLGEICQRENAEKRSNFMGRFK